jgi:hypothetical protein
VAGHPPAGLDAEQKTRAASERDEEARQAWREAVAALDPAQVVFVDESGTNSALTRLYGWAPHDRRASGTVPRHQGKNTTVVAALTPDGWHVPWMIEGAMETATVECYIREQLVPTLRPGQVVVLANLSVHKAASQHSPGHCSPPVCAALPAALLPRLHAHRTSVFHAQGHPAQTGRSHQGGALGGHAGGRGSDHSC